MPRPCSSGPVTLVQAHALSRAPCKVSHLPCRPRAVLDRSYVYEWPSLELVATLPGGTERAYSAACFDADGSLLAAVGSAPDYMLTLWSWRDRQVVLRAKAYSQEVYCVRFSPHVPGRLVTSGTGHIRFWRMASTFTGLKLQVRACARGRPRARRGPWDRQPRSNQPSRVAFRRAV